MPFESEFTVARLLAAVIGSVGSSETLFNVDDVSSSSALSDECAVQSSTRSCKVTATCHAPQNTAHRAVGKSGMGN